MTDEGPTKPPGVCEECQEKNLVVIGEGVFAIHCKHTETGAIGKYNSGGVLEWNTVRPIRRDDFEHTVMHAQRESK